MTIKEAEKAVADIRSIAFDDEAAHCAEGVLYESFVQHVADNYTGELAKIARILLTTQDIEFGRWTA